MATPQTTFTLQYERRLCKVKDEFGYFHCWEHSNEQVPDGLTIGPPPAGVISYVKGIVEFEDGVRCVDPTEIEFCDEEHAALSVWNKYEKERGKNDGCENR